MIEKLRCMSSSEYDYITFIEHPELDGHYWVQCSQYDDPGEKIGGSNMGDAYHILIYRNHETDPELYKDVDCFDAILSHPFEYISNMIKGGWYGIVARKTSKSREFIDKTLDVFRKAEYN
jgi:hypothetical protein